MKASRVFLSLFIVLLLLVSLSVAVAAIGESDVSYKYTSGGVTVEAEHVDGETDLSTIVSLADENSTIYVLKDIEMAKGSTTESAIINVTKNLTIDLGGNTLTLKQNGKNYICTGSNVTATWQNGTIVAARMDKEGYAHPVFRFPNKTNPTLNLVNVNSYTGGLVGSYSGQSINVNIQGGEHHLILKSDLNVSAMLHARAGTKLTAKSASFYVGGYPLIASTSNKATNGDLTHTYTFEDCDIVSTKATKNLISYSNEYVTVSFTGCNIVGSFEPTTHSWDTSKSYAAMKDGAITFGNGTALADGAAITENLAVCEDGHTLGAVNFTTGFTLNYSEGSLYSGDFDTASSTKTFTFAQQVVVGNDTGSEEVTDYPATQVVLGVGSEETERAVSWLSTSFLDGEVRLALASNVVDGVFPDEYVSFTASGITATNKVGFTAFDALMTGLTENTAYAYKIVMDNGESDIYYFETDSFGDYSFVFVGDPQIKTMSEGNEWSDTLDKILGNFDSELLISAGDQICTPSDETQYEYFIKNQLASIAFAPTVGPTHDNPSESYKDHFYTPNASASYGVTTSSSDYWFTYNNTLFINLNMADTSAATNGEHESFIKEAIAQNPDVTWKIVIMHVSLFSTGSHGNPDYAYYATEVGAYRAALAPVFTELGIDAVLSGHDHVYLRTNMMDGDNISDDAALDSFTVNPYGTLYLCANSSTGSKFYNKTFEPTFAAAENYEERKSAIYFTVTDNSLTLTSYFLDDMSVFDTFTIYKGEEDESIDTSFGYSCSFENNISLNTYIPEEALGEYISVYLVIERETYVDGELTVVKEIIGDYTTYSGNFRFVYDEIAACEMGDKIYTTVYAIYDDGARASDTNEYSVKEYAYNRLARSSDESFKALLVDMLNYGAAAQLYFGYDVNNLVNAELTEEQRALARTDINAESIARVENSLDGASAFIIGRSVVFNSNVELKYYVQLSESVDVSNITLLLSYTTVNGVDKSVQISGSDFVYVEEYDAYGIKYTDIAAADMSCEISATVYSGDNAISDTTIYSIESYVANKLAESTDVLFKNLITEMYKYSESAEYYFTKQ